MKKQKEENIYNIPNALTLSRIIITIVTVFLIFNNTRIEIIMALFIIGMITDSLDGQIARRFNMKTEFGRKFDMISDRLLMGGVMISLIIHLSMIGAMTKFHILSIILLISREIVAAPIALVAVFKGHATVQVRNIGKATTVMQAIAFPAVILNIYYPQIFFFAIYLAIATALLGIISGSYYINDVMDLLKPKNERPRRR